MSLSISESLRLKLVLKIAKLCRIPIDVHQSFFMSATKGRKALKSSIRVERELMRVDEVYNPKTLIEDIFIPINQSKA